MKDWTKTYQSWKLLTKNIKEDCILCNNQRYSMCFNVNKVEVRIVACPSCNWEDLQRNKKCNINMPLHLFPIWLNEENLLKQNS